MDENIMKLAAKIPVMLLGAPWTGKTEVVTRFAQDIGADLYRRPPLGRNTGQL